MKKNLHLRRGAIFGQQRDVKKQRIPQQIKMCSDLCSWHLLLFLGHTGSSCLLFNWNVLFFLPIIEQKQKTVPAAKQQLILVSCKSPVTESHKSGSVRKKQKLNISTVSGDTLLWKLALLTLQSLPSAPTVLFNI